MDDYSVKKYGAVGDGVHDDTAAIKKAIDSSTCIYFPEGTYKITSTITFFKKVGVWMFGNGSGSNGLGSSKIYWAGAPEGVIFQLYSSANCTIERLAFQGIYGGIQTNPGVGIYITGDNANGACHWNVIRDCSVSNVQGGIGYGILLGSMNNDDINTNSFENVLLVLCKVAFVQMGTQTVNNQLLNVECLAYKSMGAHFIQGNATLTNCSFFGDTTSTVDVQIGPGLLWASITGSYHEILSDRPADAIAYNFPNGQHSWTSEINNCRVLWNRGPGNIINYLQTGPLTISNCNFDGIGNGGLITVNNYAQTPQPLTLFGNNLVPGVASYAISGSVDYQNVTQQSVITVLNQKNLLSTTATQNWFDTPNSFQLLANTTYEVEGMLLLNNQNSVGNCVVSFLTGGTAIYDSIKLVFNSTVNVPSQTPATFLITSNNGGVVTKDAFGIIVLSIKGLIRVKGKGTFTPQLSYSSAPGGTPFVMPDSFLKVTPLGSNTMKSVGNVLIA